YMYQTDRGEVVIGGGVDSFPSYSQRSTLEMLEELATHAVEMVPSLRSARIMRQWAGLCDMTPDYAPIMSKVDGLEGLVLTCGWGTWGFKAAPAAGQNVAELVATGRPPDLIEPFGLSRFRDRHL
ncbi:MAG: FAD-binding oxidoreductase, partial [SAR202 cluster bacterium]|nr:FAD-binding oxidoreductase [SAR202 cluster bacterium]